MVKILSFDFNYTEARNLDIELLESVDFFETEPIADAWPDQMRIQLISKKKPQDYFPVGSLRLCSGRLMNLCRQYGVDAEFLPVQLLNKDGSIFEDKFYFIHLLDMVNCIDFKKSDITYRDQEKTWIDEVKELVIDEARAADHHLFLVEASKFIIGASEEFAEAVQRAKLSGAKFIKPSEF